MKRPLLYLSAYLKQYKSEYYERLQAIRVLGDWEGWLKFFLRGVSDVSRQAAEAARRIIAMREGHRQLIMQGVAGPSNGIALLDALYENPITDIARAKTALNISYVTANKLVMDLRSLGILEEVTERRRNRIFVYKPYLNILLEGTGE